MSGPIGSMMMAAGGVKDIEYSFVAGNTVSYNGNNSHTWSGMSVGAADPKRRIVAGFTHVDVIGTVNGGKIASVTIGGVAATKLASFTRNHSGSYDLHAEFWYVDLPLGTTADVTFAIQFGSNFNEVRVALYRMIGASMTLYDEGGTSRGDQSELSDVPLVAKNGVVLAACAAIGFSPGERSGTFGSKKFPDGSGGFWLRATRVSGQRDWTGVDEDYQHYTTTNSEGAGLLKFISLEPE